MAPTTAILILTWVALIVLYLALAAVLREVRLLRAQVARLSVVQLPVGGGDQAAPGSAYGIVLPATVAGPAGGIVLAASSQCPLCRVALGEVGAWAARNGVAATLLTYEDEAAWGDPPAGVRRVQDEAAWREVAHISPPILLRVDRDGRVLDLTLPVGEQDVRATLDAWAPGLVPTP